MTDFDILELKFSTYYYVTYLEYYDWKMLYSILNGLLLRQKSRYISETENFHVHVVLFALRNLIIEKRSV